MIPARLIATMLIFVMCSSAVAGVKSTTAREAAEYMLERFGAEVGDETVETLAGKLSRYGTKYGEEAIGAIQKTGPRGFSLIDNAGQHAPDVIRLVNKHGNEAVWVASKPKNLAIFVKHGDEAAEAMIKHPGIARQTIAKFGKPAASAMKEVSDQNARRIAMMAEDGSLNAAGKADELLGIIGKYGNKGAEFIWKHKGALAVGTVATAFVMSPEPFINGTKNLAEVAVRPIDSAAKEVGRGVAAGTNWTFVVTSISLTFVCIIAIVSIRIWRRWARKRDVPQAETP